MGGSGGGFFPGSTKPEELSEKLRKAEQETSDKKYETSVAEIIGHRLSEFNDRDVDGINKHLETIKTALDQDIEGTVDLLYGGSVLKHTYVDGLSDIDALVILNNSELMDMSPWEIKEYFCARLKDRFPNTSIEQGTLAVSVKFKDIEIQLLPAVKFKTGIRIPDSSGTQWSMINPSAFAKLLTEVNNKTGGKLVPTIKLAKSIIADLPEKRRLTGYHTEALAVEIFKNYDGSKTTKAMVKHFFNESKKYVIKPITDKTGQSVHIDDYLGSAESLERKIVADALGRIGRRMQNADGARNEKQWEEILGIE